jgi:outer membrane protein assembly factor BamA
MKLIARLAFFLWVSLAGCLPPAEAQLTAPLVNKISIRFVGPPPVSEDFIRANIRVKVGEPFTIPAADEDVKNLYSTGYFKTSTWPPSPKPAEWM